MKRVASAVVSVVVLGVISVSHAKPTASAPPASTGSQKGVAPAPVFYKPTKAGTDTTPYNTQAAATLKCVGKFTLTMDTIGRAYCNKPTSETRTVELLCPAGSQLMTEDKIPASARRFQKPDMCLKAGAPPEVFSSYTFPTCASDSTGSFQVTQQLGPDVCQKTLVNFIALPPGEPDTVGAGPQVGLQLDRMVAAMVKCPQTSTIVQDGNGVFCRKN